MPVAKSLTVMIVDDQMSMRGLTRQALQTMGIGRILEAKDGKDAIRLMSEGPIHLVLSDWNMPDMDGLTLLRTLRRHPVTKNIGFIMLTGNTSSENVRQAIEAGVNNYIAKPFDMITFKKKIEAVIGVLN